MNTTVANAFLDELCKIADAAQAGPVAVAQPQSAQPVLGEHPVLTAAKGIGGFALGAGLGYGGAYLADRAHKSLTGKDLPRSVVPMVAAASGAGFSMLQRRITDKMFNSGHLKRPESVGNFTQQAAYQPMHQNVGYPPPGYQPPVYQQPTYQQPTYEQPTYEQPVAPEPITPVAPPDSPAPPATPATPSAAPGGVDESAEDRFNRLRNKRMEAIRQATAGNDGKSTFERTLKDTVKKVGKDVDARRDLEKNIKQPTNTIGYQPYKPITIEGAPSEEDQWASTEKAYQLVQAMKERGENNMLTRNYDKLMAQRALDREARRQAQNKGG